MDERDLLAQAGQTNIEETSNDESKRDNGTSPTPPTSEQNAAWPPPIGRHALQTFSQVRDIGEPSDPAPFPNPIVYHGVRAISNVLPSSAERGVDRRGPTPVQVRVLLKLKRPKQAYLEIEAKPRVETNLGYVMFCLVLPRVRIGEENDSSLRRRDRAVRNDGRRTMREDSSVVPQDEQQRRQRQEEEEEEEDYTFAMPSLTSSYRIVAVKMNRRRSMHRYRQAGRGEDPYKEVAALQVAGDNHHVLGIEEVLQDKKYMYMVMPYCPGGDLFDKVFEEPRRGGMPTPLARYHFRKLLKSLHYLQSKGICHRDLSTENIMFDENGNALLIDLGLSLRVPHVADGNEDEPRTSRVLLKPQTACGKCPYMDPMVYLSQDSFDGYAVDLWAAGILLFALLTGNFETPMHDGLRIIYEIPHERDVAYQYMVRYKKKGFERLAEAWGLNLEEEALDLLSGILREDPRERMTLGQVMVHPWVMNSNVLSPDECDEW